MAGLEEGAASMAPPATVTRAFFGVPDGLVYPREFAPGDAVLGDLAEIAVREGWATREPPKSVKKT